MSLSVTLSWLNTRALMNARVYSQPLRAGHPRPDAVGHSNKRPRHLVGSGASHPVSTRRRCAVVAPFGGIK